MEEVEKVKFEPLEKSLYMKLHSMQYKQNGTNKTSEFLIVHDSVATIMYNISRNVLIFVKQFRPAVYFATIPEDGRDNKETDTSKYPPEIAVTLELCAGIIDKTKSEKEIAKEEILEECGYEVSLSSLEKICSYRSGVAACGSYQTVFYCEVTDDMKVSAGGGVNNEIIEVVEMSVIDVKKYLSKNYVKCPSSFLFGMYWFFYNKVH